MSDQDVSQTVSELGRKLSDVTIAMHEAIARKAGLTGTDHKYLTILMNEASLTAGELAKLAGLTTGATTAVIDRFEKLGLVKTRICPKRPAKSHYRTGHEYDP